MKRDDHPELSFDKPGPDYLSQSDGTKTSKDAGKLHQSDSRGVFKAGSCKGKVLAVYADGSELNRYEARDEAYKRFGGVAETYRKRVSDLLDIGYLEKVIVGGLVLKRPYKSQSDCEVLRISERGQRYYRQITGLP